MKKFDQTTLALFFTRGISLKTWDQIGIIDREIKPYKEFASRCKGVYFFTYGTQEDTEYQKLLPENITIFPKKYTIPSTLYSFLLPFLYKKELERVDVIKTNQMDGSWAAVFTKWMYKKKLVVRCGYELLRTLERKKSPRWKLLFASLAEWLAYKNADRIILTFHRNKEFVMKKFQIPSYTITVIPNYIDTELFKPLSLKREENQIIFVGRLEEKKNLFNLIEAISGLPVHLLLFGNGSLKEKLESFSKVKGARVEFKGNIPQTQLPEELNKSTLFTLLSLYEDSPKALLEAMACGLPCIGTNVEGIKEIIRHQENGYLCGTDTDSIREAIVLLLENRPLQHKLSDGARETIEKHFSREKMFEKELQVYTSL